MHRIPLAVLFPLVAICLPACRTAPITRNTALKAVPFEQVTVRDEFWSPRLETNRKVTIPVCLAKCEETGRIGNFARAGGSEKGPHQGALYNDSDVYKVLEGVAYALATTHDAELERRADGIIDLIASAQQPDGYLNTYYTLEKPSERWKDIRFGHELYCAGHLIEAAVAYSHATGKRKLLDCAVRLADCIDREFGPGRHQEPSGHPEIELALVKLWRATGEQRYLRLAEFFLEQRGHHEGRTSFGEYAQDHLPVREQTEAVGHCVRAMYLYCAMADVAAETHDEGMMKALGLLWRDVVERKMYITGGIGSSASNEGFTKAYDLPNDSAYCETCASIGMALWAHRMFLLTGDSQYADVMEWELYNGILSGVSLSGDRFFYDNPLGSRGDKHRVPWFDCSCCPTNLVRFLPALGERIYSQRGNDLYVALYVGSEAAVQLDGGCVRVTQETDYPWSGPVRLRIEPTVPMDFTLRLRVPGWCEGDPSIQVNGKAFEAMMVSGFVSITRRWYERDVVSMDFAVLPRRVHADPHVKADLGRVALTRGPIVYCVESNNNDGAARNLALPAKEGFDEAHVGALGVILLTYCEVVEEDRTTRQASLRAAPYFLWDNNGSGKMVVWISESADLAEAPGEGLVERQNGARITASHCYSGDTLLALNDGKLPRNSADEEIPRMTWWDHKGGVEWVQYEFEKAKSLNSASVYWFDDRGRGGCRVPATWKLLWRNEGDWKEVTLAKGAFYGTALDSMNRVEFAPVEAKAIRLEAHLKEGFSGGILEWEVK